MKKLFMFFGSIAVLVGFSSCKKNCVCSLRYDSYTTNLGRFIEYTKQECNNKEKEFKYYYQGYPFAQVICRFE